MEKVRIGMDIRIVYAIHRINGEEDLSNASNLSVRIENVANSLKSLECSFELIDKNTLSILIKGKDITVTGSFRAVVKYTKHNPNRTPSDEPFVVDSLAFESVRFSNQVGGENSCPDVSVTQIDLSTTVDKHRGGEQGAKGDAFVYSDFTAENIVELQKPALDAAKTVLETNETLIKNESDRSNRFDAKLSDVDKALDENLSSANRSFDTFMTDANKSKKALDDKNTEVITAENKRSEVEIIRVKTETVRKNSETKRVENETKRNNSEQSRNESETVRESNETNRIETLKVHVAAETDRNDNETDRVASEIDRNKNEDTRVISENQRKNNELARAESFNTIKEESATVITAAKETVTTVNASIAELLTPENVIKQSLVDPMQGRYTSFSTPRKNNDVSFKGALAEIRTEDFTLEFICRLSNAEGSGIAGYPILIVGSLNGSAIGNGITPYTWGGVNKLLQVAFPSLMDGQVNRITINKALPIDKYFSIIIGRQNLVLKTQVNGVLYEAINTELFDLLSNNITLSNAESIVSLRKFNFWDDDYARKLYNGGRWWEKTISAKNRILNSGRNAGNKLQLLSNSSSSPFFVTKMNDDKNGWSGTYEKGIGSEGESVSNYMLFYPTVNIEVGQMYSLQLEYRSNTPVHAALNGRVPLGDANLVNPKKIQLQLIAMKKIPNTSSVHGAFNILSINGIRVDQSISQYGLLCFQSKMAIEDGGTACWVEWRFSDIKEIGLQNEYLPGSLCKEGKWLDLQGNNDLQATNNDQITYNTETVVKQKIWGDGAPDLAPDMIAQTYHDLTNKVKYSAYGTATAADWIQD